MKALLIWRLACTAVGVVLLEWGIQAAVADELYGWRFVMGLGIGLTGATAAFAAWDAYANEQDARETHRLLMRSYR